MPRPKTGITETNFIAIYHYFKHSIKTERFDKDYTLLREAEKTLLATNKKIDIKESCQALQDWIAQYVTTKQWECCLKALRQQKSRKKLTLVSLDLPINVYSTLKFLSKKLNLNLRETIGSVIKFV